MDERDFLQLSFVHLNGLHISMKFIHKTSLCLLLVETQERFVMNAIWTFSAI